MAGLRILMVSHVPLVEELGAGRVQLELARELRLLGHRVETFDPRDTGEPGLLMQRAKPGWFGARAARYVRAHGHRFDVIDAHHGCLPFSKTDLQFHGLLIARSSGLYAFYSEFERYARLTWPRLIPGSMIGRALRRFAIARNDVHCRRSLETCDLALLLTSDEIAWVNQHLGDSDRWQEVPNGLTDAHADALVHAARSPKERLGHKEVAFIGAWGLRKGSADWPGIIRRVREHVPEASFSFLGTGAAPGIRGDRVRIIPSYRVHELPALLAGATVGALPSYAEGWGLGLLEQLSAGLPCVAYEVSGPRAILGSSFPHMLVRPGDIDAFANKLAGILRCGEHRYADMSAKAVDAAAPYRWRTIASNTAALYVSALAQSPLRTPLTV